jgi:hypothetical protein
MYVNLNLNLKKEYVGICLYSHRHVVRNAALSGFRELLAPDSKWNQESILLNLFGRNSQVKSN